MAFGKRTSCGYILNARRLEARPPILEGTGWEPLLPDVLPDLLIHTGYLHSEADYWKSVAGEMTDTYDNLMRGAKVEAKANKGTDTPARDELIKFRSMQRRHYPRFNEYGKLVIGRDHKLFDRVDLSSVCGAVGDVGYDALRNRVTIRHGSDRPWVIADDRVAADLKYRIYENCVWEILRMDGLGWSYSGPVNVAKTTLQETIDGRCFRNRHDRLRAYLNECVRKHPNIDEDYCRTLLERCFIIVEMYRALAAEVSEYILQTPVLRSREGGAKADILPILLSLAQGAGKSTFLRFLLPPDLEMSTDNVNFGANATDFAHETDGKAICEIPELHGIRGAALDKVKAHLSRREDNARRKYERYAITTHRRCVFIATENNSDMVPDDPSGNRRFAVIKVQRKFSYDEMVAFLNKNRDRFWASIQKRLARKLADGTGEELFLDGMAERQAALNEKHRDGDEVIESLVLDKIGPSASAPGA